MHLFQFFGKIDLFFDRFNNYRLFKIHNHESNKILSSKTEIKRKN